MAAAPVAAPLAATETIRLRAESARAWVPSGLSKGYKIPTYTWVLVRNDAGDPSRYGMDLNPGSVGRSDFDCTAQSMGGDPAYPANCKWPGIHSISGGTSGQIVAKGTQADFSESVAIDFGGTPGFGNGKYMISVTAKGFDIPAADCTPGATVCHVDGFKIDGQWFDVPHATGLVTVALQPYPLPLTTVRMKVWNDTQTNGAWDAGELPLAGFEGHINDVLGAVTTDWYGNPLCTVYQHDGAGMLILDPISRKPAIQTPGGHCLSDSNGVITIKYIGPNRYSSTVVPPNGQVWYQTSTLEGWHDWDTWAIEGWDGYDAEFVVGAEPFPFAEFGFVTPHTSLTAAAGAPTGAVKGTVVGVTEFSPALGGVIPGEVANGQQPVEKINRPLLSLIDRNANDQSIFVGRGNADGTFLISNVPDGDYNLSYWDEDQSYLITTANLTVRGGVTVDLGVLDAASWHSHVYGKVCFDTNRNGKCDPSEPGMPGLSLNLLGRDNSLQFFGDNAATTDNQGNYAFPRAYPLGQWVVAQGYWEQYYTVGATFQTNNQPNETTMMANGGFVDVSTFNLIGMTTRLDWAIHTYETDRTLGPTNGGIVGEVVYDPTRNELEGKHNATEDYEPGIPGLNMHLYYPKPCTNGAATPAGTTCTQAVTAFGNTAYYLTNSATGAYVKGAEAADPYVTESWLRPQDCVARLANGTVTPEKVLPPSTGGHDCIEAPLMTSQVGNNTVGDFMAVNGNYGFTSITRDANGVLLPAPIEVPVGDWLVEVEIPNDALTHKPVWSVTMEETVNVMTGDQFVAPGETPLNPPLPGAAVPASAVPAIPPFPCADALHTVHVVDTVAAAGFDPLHPSTTSGVYNPDFLAAGGSPFEGTRMPICNTKLVTVKPGRSATPNFYLYTETPLPGRIFGIVVDDLNLSVKPNELFYGEKKGLGGIPIGIYDFSNRLVTTIHTDPHGAFEVILPSTSTYNCPLPAGPCPGVYRFYGNDPGQPGHLNVGFDPNYRSIGAFFEVWPGVSLPADLAPTRVSFSTGLANTQTTAPAACVLNDPAQPEAPKVPEFFAIDTPYALATETGTARIRTLTGRFFGSAGTVTLDGTSATIVSWTPNQIKFRVPDVSSTFTSGPKQLRITTGGQRTVNGITVHVLQAGTYAPTILEVGPGRTGTNQFNATTDSYAIQNALDAAAALPGAGNTALVVVYPNAATTWNPFGSYYSNVIVHINPEVTVKLQGVGPGGVRDDATQVIGSVLDGLGFGTDSARDDAWLATLDSLGTIVGPNGVEVNADAAPVPVGEVVLFVSDTATTNAKLPVGQRPAIDGFTVQNGDVMDFIPNTNSLGNGAQVRPNNNAPTNPNQGGGIAAFASIQNLEITNNILKANAGAYAGAIRIGTPMVGNNHMDYVHIANNRIIHNGGTNLAGAIGIFTGANGYEINNNDICGNFSAEYGGGISHFGQSGGSSIHDNRVYFNGSYDEGAGIIVAGELPATPTSVSPGAGAVNVYNNLIQANLAGDDGGGIRFLTAGNFPFNVYNNFIVNNISTHEGGGIAIDNAPNLRFYNNTVMKNITTATAATSNGQPQPAGLSTAQNDRFLQATLDVSAPSFSDPLMFNNIFWDNRAGTWDPSRNLVSGIGGTDALGNLDPTPINHWDMGVVGLPALLHPTTSVIQTTTGYTPSGTNEHTDPLVWWTYDTSVIAQPWRGNGNFVANVIIAHDVPVTIMGDYHLSEESSPAVNNGAASKAVPGYQQPPATLNAPAFDIDNEVRPMGGGFDIGADELSPRPEPFIPAPAAPAAAPAAAPQAPAIVPAAAGLRPRPAALQTAPFSIVDNADAYHAQWVAQSAYPTVAPGQLAEWVVAFKNTGTAGWYRGVLGANAGLGTSQPLNNEFAEKAGLDPGNWQYPSRVAVQTTDYVAPGQIGWFVVQVRAPKAPGTFRFNVRPVVDGLTWLEDYGVYFELIVVAPKTGQTTSDGVNAFTISAPEVALMSASSAYASDLVARGSFENIGGGVLP